MYKEIEVDINLYYLECILFDLDKYKFDSDISNLLNDLKILIDKKIWSNVKLDGTYVIDDKIKIKLFLEK